MNQEMFKTGSFTAAASPAIVTVNLGWIPDFIEIINIDAANAVGGECVIKWQKGMDNAAGLTLNAAQTTGAVTSVPTTSVGPTIVNTAAVKPAQWVASATYAVGDIVHPSTNNGYFYRCSVAGAAGASEPTWGTTVAGNTTDNAVTWVCYDQKDLPVNRAKVQGFSIPIAAQVASCKCYWRAWRDNQS